MAAVQTQKPALTPARPDPTTPTDRRIGGWLFVFFLALYLLTSSGHLYSPDGEFAFRLARSLTIDPKHEYLIKMRQSLTQWGIMVPVLSQPFILLGDPLASLMPQKDHATVDGRDFKIGYYRHGESESDIPTVGSKQRGGEELYARTDLPDGPASSLAIISFLSYAKDLPQGTVVAEVTVVGKDGSETTLPVRAGIETAEWSRGRTAPPIQHEMARVASVWNGNTAGRNFHAELPLGNTLEPRELRIRYVASEGQLFVRALAFLDKASGAFRPVDSEWAYWSPRENNEYLALVFYGSYNATVTALTCLLVFALARVLGYSLRVSTVAALVYGLATIAWPYSKYDFTEPTLTLLVTAAVYSILRWGQNRRDRFLLGAGILALMAAITKYVAAILIPVLVLQIALLHWREYPSIGKLRGLIRPLLAFSLPFLALAIPSIYFLSTRFGYYPSIFGAWAGIQRGWLPLPFEIGLRGLLFSPGRSFFLYSPPAMLALLAVVPFVRRYGVRSVAILGIILVYFTIYGKKVAWDAGSGWGPRYQVAIVPLVVIIAAYLIEKAIEDRRRWARYALIATFILGFGIQMLAVPKNFDFYLGMFRDHIVTQMPDKGAQYGGGDYYPHAEGLSDANRITATVWAWQFSPILAHAWLLSADVLDLARPYLSAWENKLLGMPPWRMAGIDLLPPHPEYGLGLDFWSTRLFVEFPSHTGMLAGVMLVLLALEAAIILVGARLISFLRAEPMRSGWVRAWMAGAAAFFLAFNGIHFLL